MTSLSSLVDTEFKKNIKLLQNEKSKDALLPTRKRKKVSFRDLTQFYLNELLNRAATLCELSLCIQFFYFCFNSSMLITLYLLDCFKSLKTVLPDNCAL